MCYGAKDECATELRMNCGAKDECVVELRMNVLRS